MAYIYSTNSPYYLDYLAACRTRQEILDDPELCQYLENPLLKDNMELALAYNDAKHGGYAEKKNFVEYLFCNGPEIDTDTILYYRDKCYKDPVYLQIAQIEFNDFSIVDQLRTTKYNKSNDLADCFTKPCNYLGPLSSSIGILGDSNNFRTFPNIFSTLLHGTDEQKKDLKAAWGGIKEHLTSKIMPHIRLAMQVMYDDMYNHLKEFSDECKQAGIADHIFDGDPLAIARADDIAQTVRVNTFNKLGDCARLWEHMRRFNPYDVNQNQRGPVSDDKMRDNRAASGAAVDRTKRPHITTQMSESKLKEAAAKGNKQAQWQLELQNLDVAITEEDYKKLADTTIDIRDRVSFGLTLVKKMTDPDLDSSQNEYRETFRGNEEAIQALEAKNKEELKLMDKVRKLMDILIKQKNDEDRIVEKGQLTEEERTTPLTDEEIKLVQDKLKQQKEQKELKEKQKIEQDFREMQEIIDQNKKAKELIAKRNKELENLKKLGLVKTN